MTKHDSDTIAGIHEELHSHLPSEPALRVKALESLLVEKGMVDPARRRRLGRGLYGGHRPQTRRGGRRTGLDRS